MIASLYSNGKCGQSDHKKRLVTDSSDRDHALITRMSDSAQTPCFLATPQQITGQNWHKSPVINLHITNNITVTQSSTEGSGAGKEDLRRTKQNFATNPSGGPGD